MILTTEENEQAAAVFKALAHPVRLAVVQLLADEDRCVQDLTAAVGFDISTVSRHLAQLKASGVLGSRREGNCIYYSLRARCVLSFLKCVLAPLDAQVDDSPGSCPTCGGEA